MEMLEINKKYIDQCHVRHYSENTIESYLYHLQKFFDFCKPKHASILSSQDVNDYLVHLSNAGKSDSYKNQAINAIRFCFKYVFNRKLKAYLVFRPKKAKTSPILLSDSELQSLFDVCKNKKHKAIMALIVSAGLRVSEIINLKIKDIDSKSMVIRVVCGKGRKDRMVVLDMNVLINLREYFAEYRPQEYLFNGQTELKYTSRSIGEFLKKYAALAGIKKRIYPHLLRHQQITGMLENGNDIHAIKIHSGHSSQRTTAQYIHMSPKYISSLKSPIQNIRL